MFLRTREGLLKGRGDEREGERERMSSLWNNKISFMYCFDFLLYRMWSLTFIAVVELVERVELVSVSCFISLSRST